MPRPPRDCSPGFHHVIVGATGSEPYFRDDIDRFAWIRQFSALLGRYGWTCAIFCQLNTHVHFLVDLPDSSLSTGMHRLNGEYCRRFNNRHDRRGALQRTRYWSEAKRDREALLAAYRYIARNPVEAGVVPDPVSWPWSSFATSCGLSKAFPFVRAEEILEELGGDQRALRDLAA